MAIFLHSIYTQWRNIYNLTQVNCNDLIIQIPNNIFFGVVIFFYSIFLVLILRYFDSIEN